MKKNALVYNIDRLARPVENDADRLKKKGDHFNQEYEKEKKEEILKKMRKLQKTKKPQNNQEG